MTGTRTALKLTTEELDALRELDKDLVAWQRIIKNQPGWYHDTYLPQTEMSLAGIPVYGYVADQTPAYLVLSLCPEEQACRLAGRASPSDFDVILVRIHLFNASHNPYEAELMTFQEHGRDWLSWASLAQEGTDSPAPTARSYFDR